MSQVLLLADLHGGENRIDRNGRVLTHGSKVNDVLLGVKKCIINIGISAAINLGDLGSCKETHKNIQGILESTGIKWYNLLGNKELQYIDREIESTKHTLGYNTPTCFHLGGLDHVLLDIELHGEHGLRIPQSSIAFLRQHIVTRNKPFMIYVHTPCSLHTGNIGFDDPLGIHQTFAENARELQDILDGSSCIGVISGHTHFAFSEIIRNILHITIPGITQNNNGEPDGRVGILDTETGEIRLEKII